MAQVNPTPEHGQEDPKSPVELGVKSAEITHFPIKHPQERGRLRWLKDMTGSGLKWGFRLATLTAIIAGGYMGWQYKTNPDFHQRVQSTIDNLLSYRHKSEVASGVINSANSVQMTEEEYKKSGPPVIEGNNVNLPILIRPPEGAVNSSIKYTIKANTFGLPRKINIRPNPDNPNERLFDQEIDAASRIIYNGVSKGSILSRPPIEKPIISISGGPSDKTPDGVLKRVVFSVDGYDSWGNKVHHSIAVAAIKPFINIDDIKKNKTGIPLVDTELGIIATEEKWDIIDGQIEIEVSSFVKENGVESGGPANIKIAVTPQGQEIMLR